MESMQAMPRFAATLSDDELAHLANYLRSGRAGRVM
jgi:cytochrome c553